MKLYALSDRGKVRKENQDSFLLHKEPDERYAVAVVCDGMGGALAGSTASAMAAESFMTHVRSRLDGEEDAVLADVLREAAKYANLRVYDRSYTDFGCMGMGTTLVGVIIRGDECLAVNVGDSRLYHISNGAIRQISEDHSLVEHLIRAGQISRKEGRNHPQKNIITRAVGVEQSVELDIFSVNLSAGDRLLLCSDGLSNTVEDDELLAEICGHTEPEAAGGSLMHLALERGARDNVTLAVVWN